ncbi:hypothetical protein [Maribacter polysaccharolyticus]|uniref:hypothetical protein n=1 Tax=Maribacter polysaccharolyticus TaxID=3020831 RepID=UPI00237F3274|nr:hypothetical protein [Maribacter polysaccharolyticus]MDE3743277.1 hypothetical protein [Maribacter polysaccharolyticus]
MSFKEVKMNQKELKKIYNKWISSIFGMLFFGIIFSFIFYLVYDSHSKPFQIGTLMFLIILGFFLFMGLLNLLGLFFSPNSLIRDLNQKKKIITKLKIENKKLTKKAGSYFISGYVIYFNDNEFLTTYAVSKNTFEKVNIGDEIYLECSKFGKWIIDIQWNSESIENRSYVK